MFPLHQIAHVGVSQSRGLRLFGREIILEEFQPVSSRYLIVTDGQTKMFTSLVKRNLCLKSFLQTKAISIPRYGLVHRAVKTDAVLSEVHDHPSYRPQPAHTAWAATRPLARQHQSTVGLHLRNPSLMDYYSFN